MTDDYDASFDLAFIDGEHTDEACFRDFLWTLPLLKPNSVILFHDSGRVYKALKIIMLYLDKANIKYTFFKRAKSGISALFFGNYRDKDFIGYLGPESDQSKFFARAEANRIKDQFLNRYRLRFDPRKLFKLKTLFRIDIEEPKRFVCG